jgi:hypothetical protein
MSDSNSNTWSEDLYITRADVEANIPPPLLASGKSTVKTTLAAILALTLTANAATVSTGSLSLTIDTSGRVTGTALHGSALPVVGTGGFELADFAVSTNTFNAVSGVTSATSGGIAIAATNSTVRLDATITTNANTIAVSGTLTNLAASDRAIALRFRLPVNLSGWTWHDDTVTTRTVSGATVFRSVTPTEAGAGEQSFYPVAALTQVTNGLAIATPMTNSPRVFVLSYDNVTTGLVGTVYLSLSTNATKNLNSGSFSWVLYPTTGSNAFRSALSTYYTLYSTAFAPRPSFQCAYRWGAAEYLTPTNTLYIGPTNNYATGTDFTSRTYDYIIGMHGCYYAASWPDPLGTNSVMPSDAAVKAWLATQPGDPWSAVPTGAAAVQQLEEDSTGALRYVFSTYTPGVGWTFMWRVNEDPDLTDGLTSILDSSVAGYGAHSAYVPSLDVDGGDGFVGLIQLDYATAHLAAMDYPPTFGASSLKPAIVSQIWDFYSQYLWPKSASNTFTVIGNAGSPDLLYVAPFLDVTMTEGINTWANFRRYRALTGHRVLRNWTTITPAAGQVYTDAQFALELNQCLSLGIYPSLAMTIYGGKIEDFRPLYRLYHPIIETLSAAGWQPMTHASAPGAIVERFGTSYFSVNNPTGAPLSTTVTVDTASLGLGSIKATDMLSSATVSSGGTTFPVTLQAGETRAYSISAATGGMNRLKVTHLKGKP